MKVEERKKEFLKSFLFFIFCVAGLVILTVFMSFPIKDTVMQARNGELDISKVKLDKKIINLQGQWEFYFGQILTPRELEGKEADYINLPEEWTKFNYPRFGSATYRLTINTDKPERLTLLIPSISDAAKVWVNNETAYVYGLAGNTKAATSPGEKETFYTFTTKNNRAEIVIAISDFYNYKSGMINSLRLGRENVLYGDFIRRFGLYAFSLGILFMMGIHHLILYLQRKEKLYLVFSLICLFGFTRFVFENGGVMAHYDFLSQKIKNNFYFISYFLYDYLILYFTLILTKSKALSHIVFKWHILPVVTSLAVLFTSTENLMLLILFLCLYAPAVFIISAFLLWRSPERRKNYYFNLYLFTFIFFVFMGYAYRIFLVDTYFMMAISSFLLLMTVQSIMLSAHYIEAFRQVEVLNMDLENRVNVRTHELQTANLQLITANEELAVSRSAINELLVNISHDLKTPITVLSLNLQSLLSDRINLTEEEKQSCLNVAYNKNLTISRLIKNLFDVTRIETGQLAFRLSWIGADELMETVYQKYNDYILSLGLTLSIHLKEEFYIAADNERIWSVFDNIIYNAVRYTKQGGNITVSGKLMPENKAEIRIKDTGNGIAPEHIPYLFNRFYKVSRSRSEKDGEGGVGLYIVKSCIEGMGGIVWAESMPGEGTTIIFTLRAEKNPPVSNDIIK